MKETNLSGYVGSEWAKALYVAEGKAGKTTGMLASMLGLLPWQTEGGLVTDPSHLHVISVDADALGGALNFLVKSCGADPKDVGRIHVLNLQEDLRKVTSQDNDYSGAFYGEIMKSVDRVRELSRPGQVHAMIFSSLTGFASGLLRALSGGVSVGTDGNMKKSNMDQNKWAMYAMLLSELQLYGQQDGVHCFWEGHLTKKPVIGSDGKQTEIDTLLIQGRQGDQWPYNVEQVFRFRRLFGQRHAGTQVDKTFLDTRPSLAFIANGRGFNEKLDAQEPCLTSAFTKLGLKVGGWRAAARTAAKPSLTKPQPPAAVVKRAVVAK